ncbi:MAG: hypothetical protein OSB43_16595 [Nocardioides sp.]|uniref:hypothetical protein n=1 Tax=Nocardioides sp. TaxID=35761 RepID=UPI00238626BA|nr:hypothetical protein [Nocardioides sp.]MDE0777896.1 hypothetical protein [Nocardioides sp.]
MSAPLPIVVSLDLRPRFLAQGPGSPGELRVLLVDDDDPLDWGLPRVPKEAQEKGSVMMQKRRLTENLRDGAARHSIATSLCNLAALYIVDGRSMEATSALYEADQWFAEIPVYHPPSGKYDLVGRSIVAYNAAVLAKSRSEHAGCMRQRDMLDMFLDAVPQADRLSEFEFVQVARAQLGS